MQPVIAILLALLTAFWIAPTIGPLLIPARWFIEVDRVLIGDSHDGTAPQVMSFRTVHRPFTGDFTVYVRRFMDDQVSAPYCIAHAQRPFTYFPAHGPLANIDLDWWMEIPPNPPCPWTPGRYIATTEWRILLPFDIVLTATATSNVFAIQ